MCKNYILKALNCSNLYEYTSASGDIETRKEVLEYFKKEGIVSERELSVDNITFTMATTQAFDIIVKAIAKPFDVILMTGPTWNVYIYS